MQHVSLGRTGFTVCRLGFGGIPLFQGSPMGTLSESEALGLLRAAFDRGINYIDTALSYGDSEVRIGKALKGGYRERVFVATKTYIKNVDDPPAQFAADIDASLERLDLDYIDCYQIHYIDRNSEWAYRDGGVLDVMKRAQEQGKIRFLGVTAHEPQPAIEAVKTGEFVLALVPYSPINRANEPELLPLCTELGVATVIMKPVAGGILATDHSLAQMLPPEKRLSTLALRFVLSNPNVTLACPGMDSLDEVEENLSVVAGEIVEPLTPEEEQAIGELAARIGDQPCRRCGYCHDVCPVGIRNADIFRLMQYLQAYDLVEYAREQYARMEHRVDECLDCGLCEQKCPYRIPIRERHAEAHQALSA